MAALFVILVKSFIKRTFEIISFICRKPQSEDRTHLQPEIRVEGNLARGALAVHAKEVCRAFTVPTIEGSYVAAD